MLYVCAQAIFGQNKCERVFVYSGAIAKHSMGNVRINCDSVMSKRSHHTNTQIEQNRCLMKRKTVYEHWADVVHKSQKGQHSRPSKLTHTI